MKTRLMLISRLVLDLTWLIQHAFTSAVASRSGADTQVQTPPRLPIA